jgi:hypothetical protein
MHAQGKTHSFGAVLSRNVFLTDIKTDKGLVQRGTSCAFKFIPIIVVGQAHVTLLSSKQYSTRSNHYATQTRDDTNKGQQGRHNNKRGANTTERTSVRKASKKQEQHTASHRQQMQLLELSLHLHEAVPGFGRATCDCVG